VTLGGGTIKASAGGNALYANVTLAGGGTLGAAGSTYINWYCNIAGTGDLTIAGPVWAGGTRSITTTGKIIINPMSAGVYFQPGDGTLQCDEVVINGTLNPWATTISAISGNGQLVLQSSGLTINQNKDTTFAGTISGASGTWTKSGSFALTLTGANTYTGATTVNAGTLRVNGSIGTGAVTVNGSGTLGGTGVINGATTVQSGGVLAPGNNGISLLTVSNNVTLQGTTVMELSKAGGTWTNDQLAASGALTYGGALVLTNLSTNALVLSNSFKLFNAGSYAGAFQSVLPSPGYGMAWDTNQLAVNGTIVVGPPPATCTLTYLAGTNGTIVGQTPQTVAYGSNGTPVTAQANTGYLFVNWSDGGTNNPRTDMVVTADFTATANFAVIAGQTLVWDANPVAGGVQDGSGVWGSGGTNWLFAGGNILWYDANTAVFGANTTTNCTVTIANDVTPAGIIFNATGGGSYTLAGGGGGINLAGSPTITASNSATISAVLKGMGSLTKAGSGTLTLSSTNAFTGGTTINAGILAFSSGTGMGAGSVTINDGGNLQIIGGNNYTVANPIGVSGAITISRTNNWIQTLSGSISGTGTLTLTSPTTGNSWDILTISGANSFSGTLIAGGALNLQFADFIWTGNPLLTLSDSYAVNLGNNTFAGLTGSGNGYGGAVTLNPAGNCTYSGVLSNATSIIISGTGTQTFSGTNTYTGTTTVSGGTLLINGVIGTNTVTVAVGGTLGGTGVIKGATTVQNGGVLAPGNNGLGKLTVSNSVTLAGGSTAMMELSRNGGVPTNSLAFISGTLTQGGSLVVANLGTNNLALGDSFKLFNAATYAGAFTNLTLPALTNGVNWNTSTLATNGTLSVIASTYMLNYLAAANGTVSGAATQTVAFGGSGTAVSAVANTGYRFVNWSDGSVANPRTDAGVTNNLTVTANFALLVPPVITNLNLAASGSSFSVTGTGATNAPYVLLGATNLPPVMWIPLLTNYADASGRFTLTDVQTTNYPRRFYRVLAQ
jgi:autotransporter-associated beta strand protein